MFRCWFYLRRKQSMSPVSQYFILKQQWTNYNFASNRYIYTSWIFLCWQTSKIKALLEYFQVDEICTKEVFDWCKQSLKQFLHPSIHPSVRPSVQEYTSWVETGKEVIPSTKLMRVFPFSSTLTFAERFLSILNWKRFWLRQDLNLQPFDLIHLN